MTSRLLPDCRVIVDRVPQSGAWNMAVDELLLQAAVDDDRSSLRWYRWDQPTVSVGYFQDPAAIGQFPKLALLPVVRRLSGGGAIVHDVELTYACALPASHPLAREPRELYTLIHGAIVDVLAEFGVIAKLRGSEETGRSGEFLCFSRGDSFDVVVGAEKVLGSAQRRRKGAILQHGALVLRRSAYAPQFSGILDLVAVTIDVERLLERLVAQVAGLLSENVYEQPLSAAELDGARKQAAGPGCVDR